MLVQPPAMWRLNAHYEWPICWICILLNRRSCLNSNGYWSFERMAVNQQGEFSSFWSHRTTNLSEHSIYLSRLHSCLGSSRITTIAFSQNIDRREHPTIWLSVESNDCYLTTIDTSIIMSSIIIPRYTISGEMMTADEDFLEIASCLSLLPHTYSKMLSTTYFKMAEKH